MHMMNSLMLNVQSGTASFKMEIRNALEHMRYGGTPGSSGITAEVISALEECGVVWIARLPNTAYDTGDVPPDLCKSIFTAVPKRAGTLECDQHQSTGLVGLVVEIMLGTVVQRVLKKVQSEVSEEWCEFVEGKRAVCLQRTIAGWMEVNGNQHLYFIDCTGTFGGVRHVTMIEMLLISRSMGGALDSSSYPTFVGDEMLPQKWIFK